MRIPIIRGLIDRRILVNYRVDADVMARAVPDPFRPQVFGGYAIAGICLIRLKHIRPRWLPGFVGIGSENAAHRIAVEWEEEGAIRQGVYIPRRDTSSIWNTLVGGRLFPGVHHHSRFTVTETSDDFSIDVSNADGMRVAVEAKLSGDLPGTSVFSSLSQASDFFARGSTGYSCTRCAGIFDGLKLCTSEWKVAPLAVRRAESSFFGDPSIFPSGSVEFDCALMMRNIPHEWRGLGNLVGSAATKQRIDPASRGCKPPDSLPASNATKSED
jgi:hypothetical protein